MPRNTKNLSIYKASYELVKTISDAVCHFSRAFRPTLGTIMTKEALDLVLHVYRANAALDKVPHIEKVIEHLQVTEMLLQMSFDLHLINQTTYAKCIDLTESIADQAGRWKSHSKKYNLQRSNQPV